MVAIPRSPTSKIKEAIYEAYEQADRTDSPEPYLGRLGASSIGRACPREVFFSWRGYTDTRFEGRMLRLFQTGHLQEDRIVADLKAAGLTVWEVDDEGKQFEFHHPSGHFICKVDGVVKGVPDHSDEPHVLEIKTHNKNSFSELSKKGVKNAKPEHLAQMQTGMLYSGMKHALYVALCKDDERFHIERVAFDESLAKKLDKKIQSMIGATIKPAPIQDDFSKYPCTFCDHRRLCTGEGKPEINCRTCVNSKAVENGEWLCELHGTILDMEDQLNACDEYEVLI